MQKRQAPRVQTDGPAERVHRAVAGVAVNRMAVVGELHAELVGAAGLRAQLQQRQPAVLAALLEVQERLPGAGERGATTSTRLAGALLSIFSQSSSEPASVFTSPSTTAQ